jgi:hypothetical protein
MICRVERGATPEYCRVCFFLGYKNKSSSARFLAYQTTVTLQIRICRDKSSNPWSGELSGRRWGKKPSRLSRVPKAQVKWIGPLTG